MFEFSGNSNKNKKGIHPFLNMTVERAIQITPIDFGIPRDGGVRTAERQKEMYRDPLIRTRCDGFDDISEHQAKSDSYGYAVDFYAYINGNASWELNHLTMVFTVLHCAFVELQRQGKIKWNYELVWGGTFNSNNFDGWDKPHVQLVKI